MICTKCHEDKPQEDFNLRNDRPKGLISYCKPCLKIVRNVRRVDRRRMLAKIKIDRGCIDCGFKTHPAALHFDHREPEKKCFMIAHDVERSWDEILKEIEKCDVRCANCHAIRHAIESLVSKAVAGSLRTI